MSKPGDFGDSVYESGDAVDDAENLDPVEDLTGDDPDETMQTGYSPPEREPELHHVAREDQPEDANARGV